MSLNRLVKNNKKKRVGRGIGSGKGDFLKRSQGTKI